MVYFLGDTHGEWEVVLQILKEMDPGDTLIHVGDVGVGFPGWKSGFRRVVRSVETRDLEFLAIRGNHDDPALFTDEPGSWNAGAKLVKDYSRVEREGYAIGMVGGAVSIDRKGRQKGVSWWPGEGVVSGEVTDCDILVSHLSPSDAPPLGPYPAIVTGWINRDPDLAHDLPAEREIMKDIVKRSGASLNLFGHYHDSLDLVCKSIRYRGLNINELVSLAELFVG